MDEYTKRQLAYAYHVQNYPTGWIARTLHVGEGVVRRWLGLDHNN